MKDLVFRSVTSTVNVRFRTDLINDEAKNFTVMDIQGLTDNTASNPITYRDQLLLREFKKLPYTIQAFKLFAQNYELELKSMNADGTSVTTLVAMPTSSASDSES